MLARLALRPDRALLLASAGVAAAILLPVSSTLVLAGLAPVQDAGWVAYPLPGHALEWQAASPAPTLVAGADLDPHRMAYLKGSPVVAPGQVLAMPQANGTLPPPSAVPRSPQALPLLRSDALLVHPQDAPGAVAVAALFDSNPGPLPGAVVAPARGADAFESATLAALARQGLWVILLSIPAVALVAVAFARQEVRAQGRRGATLDALGGHRAALAILVGRMLLMAALGALLATAAGGALYRWGGPLFHPSDAPRLRLAASILLPAAAAAAGGVAAALRGRQRLDLLRGEASDAEPDVPVRIDLALRPLLLGVRLLPILLLAAALFLADVGFPAAAIAVPASLAGGEGEWVIGGERGLVAGQGVDATAAAVAGLDPRVAAIVAETVAPTLVDGQPAIVRGGAWEALAAYHGLRIVQGGAGGADQAVLGTRLAQRIGAAVGQEVAVQGADRAEARWLRVAGLADGPGGMPDEAFVDTATGQALANLGPGQSSLVRFRPETEAARDAVFQKEPNLVVTAVTLEPTAPAAGSIAAAAVTVANLGVEAGVRGLAVRLDGTAFAHLEAAVPGHARVTLRVPFVVPAGAFRVDVNPTAQGEAEPAPRTLDAPRSVAAGTPFEVRVLAAGTPQPQARVALYASAADAANGTAPLAEAVTDAEGRATLAAPAPGSLVAGLRDPPRAFAQVQAVAGPGALVVEQAWTVPASVQLHQVATLHGLVRNPGAAAANGSVPAFIGAQQFAAADVALAPGASTVVSFPLYIGEPADTVRVGNSTLRLGSRADPTAAPLPTDVEDIPREEAVAGGAVRAQVANRALGDAQGALLALAGCALGGTLAVVTLATRRTLAGRRHVARLLEAVGQEPERIRSRAALEGAALGGAAFAAVLLPAKLLFLAIGAWGPAVFAHSLPDPVTPLFAVQGMAAFAAACSLAAYLGAGRWPA